MSQLYSASLTPEDAGVTPGEAPQNPTAPEMILGKFKDQGALIEAYKALEAKLGQRPADNQQPPANTPEVKDGEATASDAKIPEKQAEQPNTQLDWQAFADEYSEKGALSAETYTALEFAGIPKHVVDVYVAGQQARVNALNAQIFSAAGGQEAYSELTTWAAENLSAETINAFNRTVDSGDLSAITLAVAGLKAQHQTSGRTLQGNPAANVGADTSVFQSLAEVSVAQRDARYRRDPAYRAAIEAKLARSHRAGTV